MKKFRLISNKDIWGKGKKILGERTYKAEATDFGIVTGTATRYDKKTEGNVRVGKYWIDGTRTNYVDDRSWGGGTVIYDCMQVICLNPFDGEEVDCRKCGIRLAMDFSSIGELQKNKGSVVEKNKEGLFEVEYGYYPQTILSQEKKEEIEEKLKSNVLKKTKGSYSTYEDGRNTVEVEGKKHFEYQDTDGRRYVRVNLKDWVWFNGDTPLVRDENRNFYDYLWFEVEPVKWLLDKENKMMVTDKIILGGVIYNDSCLEEKRDEEDYENTSSRKFINRFLKKELLNCRLEPIKEEELKKGTVQKVKPVKVTRRHNKEEARSSVKQGIRAFFKIGNEYRYYDRKERINRLREER